MEKTTNVTTNILAAKDLSKRLQIGRDRAYRLMKNPSFPSTQLGCRYFVTEQALSNWLIENQYKQVLI